MSDLDDSVNRINSGGDVLQVSSEALGKVWQSVSHVAQNDLVFGGILAASVDRSMDSDQVLALWIRIIVLKHLITDSDFESESTDKLLDLVAVVEMNGSELISFTPIRRRILGLCGA